MAQKDVNCLSAVKENGQPVSYVPAPCLGDICLPGDMLSDPPGNECFRRAMPSRQGCRVVPWQTAIQPQVPGVLTPIPVSTHAREFPGPHLKPHWSSYGRVRETKAPSLCLLPSWAVVSLCYTQGCAETSRKEGSRKGGVEPPVSPGPSPSPGHHHWAF